MNKIEMAFDDLHDVASSAFLCADANKHDFLSPTLKRDGRSAAPTFPNCTILSSTSGFQIVVRPDISGNGKLVTRRYHYLFAATQILVESQYLVAFPILWHEAPPLLHSEQV